MKKAILSTLLMAVIFVGCEKEDDGQELVNQTPTNNNSDTTTTVNNDTTTLFNNEKNSASNSNDSVKFNFFNINVVSNTPNSNRIEFSITEKDPTNPQSAGQFGNLMVIQVQALPISTTTYSHFQSGSSNWGDTEYIYRSIQLSNNTWYSELGNYPDTDMEIKFENGVARFTITKIKLNNAITNATISDEFNVSFSIPISELKDSNSQYFQLFI